jgi:2-oxoisovalerate dehydrogenase E2 component (dihydrolipoyl transacylase)
MSAGQVFALPDLGEGLTEAEIVEWHVGVGDEVEVDQHVVTVETAKAAVDVPCPYAGRVVTLHGDTGQMLEVGQPLITVADATAAEASPAADAPEAAGAEQYCSEERAGTTAPEDDSGSGAVLIGYGTGAGGRRRRRAGRRRAPAYESGGGQLPVAQVPETEESVRETAQPAATRHGAVKVISPLVRKLALDAGLDLASIRPASPDGVIRRADVVEASAEPAAATAAVPTPSAPARAAQTGDTRIPLTGVRRVIADKLSTSRREIPDATTWVDADATELMAVKDALKRARPDDGIGVLALMARIVVAGLRRHPALNSSVDTAAGEIVQHAAIHLGFAAQSPRGLVVPVVKDAGEMTTAQLAAALRDLTTAAREGSLSPAQLTGGTFTLNNYGVFGVDGSTPIINHPEAAMLGVGRIIDRPWAHEGQLALRKVTQLSFTFDHRVCDGGTAGGFLRFVADCVEQPSVLLAEL